jgi:hypothetical protein
MLDDGTLPLEGGFSKRNDHGSTEFPGGHFARTPLASATRVRLAKALVAGSVPGITLTPSQAAWLCRVARSEIADTSRRKRAPKSICELWDLAPKAERQALLVKILDMLAD